MRVVKFGGSSVADAAHMRRVAAIVAELRTQGPVAVVVSAMAGVTDALLRAGQAAISGDARLPELLDAVALRHYEAWAALAVAAPDGPGDFARLWRAVTAEAQTLAWRGAGLSEPARARLVARFSGWGERLEAPLLAAALREAGLLAEAFDEAPVMLQGAAETEGAPEPSLLATRARLLPQLAMLVMRGGVPVLPGYIVRDATGALTTLGRNGSDHSAAVIAAALGAERLTIYSDVPGMLTADPRIVPDATLLPALTYAEAQRMAALGARALHPRTIEPLARWGIPLELRGADTPHAPGTDIMPAMPQGRARDAAWIVAVRPLAADARLVEVSAAWLPAWPLTGNPAPPRECLAPALATPALARFAAQAASTPDGVRLLVATPQAEAATRALHAALRDCAAQAVAAAGA